MVNSEFLLAGMPFGFKAGDVNLFRYVNNSPVNFTDPSGLFIYFADAKDAAKWAEEMKSKYGAKDVVIAVGEPESNGKSAAYVGFGPGDREAIFKYADQAFSKVFVDDITKDKDAQLQSALRNRFLAGAGVFGGLAKNVISSTLTGQSIPSFEPKAIVELSKFERALKGKGVAAPVILNIGGEGDTYEPKGAMNVNVTGVKPGVKVGVKQSIPLLLSRAAFDEDFSYMPDGCADEIHMISVGLRGNSLVVTASEVARIVKDGGTIILSNPDEDTAYIIHRAFIDAIGDRGDVVQEVKPDP